MPIINKSANMIFEMPTKYINHNGRPYTLNSSFIEFESPPLNLVFLLNLISHTFNNVRATIKFTSIVKKAIRQNYKK